MEIKSILKEVKEFVKNRQNDIWLFLIIALACLLCFALGYLFCIYTHKQAPVFGGIEESSSFFLKNQTAISVSSTDELY